MKVYLVFLFPFSIYLSTSNQDFLHRQKHGINIYTVDISCLHGLACPLVDMVADLCHDVVCHVMVSLHLSGSPPGENTTQHISTTIGRRIYDRSKLLMWQTLIIELNNRLKSFSIHDILRMFHLFHT